MIDAAKVPGALERHGLKARFRHGPTPRGFVSALYGTAENKRHVQTRFGILLTARPGAERYYRKGMLKLVPGAKLGDATVGLSYVTITVGNPKTRAYSRVSKEEDVVQSKVWIAVAGLAPKALSKESP
ncbi:MAG TPA: hypothetical protein VH061_02735 [Solirubrobacteraceae bacterium]|nr:hypothetical protein [Solirubrobacteraceae bacterium]